MPLSEEDSKRLQELKEAASSPISEEEAGSDPTLPGGDAQQQAAIRDSLGNIEAAKKERDMLEEIAKANGIDPDGKNSYDLKQLFEERGIKF